MSSVSRDTLVRMMFTTLSTVSLYALVTVALLVVYALSQRAKRPMFVGVHTLVASLSIVLAVSWMEFIVQDAQLSAVQYVPHFEIVLACFLAESIYMWSLRTWMVSMGIVLTVASYEVILGSTLYSLCTSLIVGMACGIAYHYFMLHHARADVRTI